MTEHTTHYDDCGCQSAKLAARVAELEAHANALRDALVKSRDMLCEDGDWLPGTSRAHECITDALISTPAASLAAHDAEVLAPYLKALRSIAANTCCDRCQEAAWVAKSALAAQAATHSVPGGTSEVKPSPWSERHVNAMRPAFDPVERRRIKSILGFDPQEVKP